VLATAALLAFAADLFADQQLNAQEITALVSGKTLEGTQPMKGIKVITYFAPDGTFRRLWGDDKEHGTWSVSAKDELCMSGSEGTTCRVMERQGEVWNAYRIPKNIMKPRSHERQWVKVLDGNPYNL
jgi:hypothetical protein